METENNSSLPFLDILVKKKNNNTLETSIYRKPTFSGLGVNFISQCYEKFKYNTFTSMFYRAFKLTSSYINFHEEIIYLKTFFQNNGYLNRDFNKSLRSFLNKQFAQRQKLIGPKKLDFYFKVPFLDNKTNEFLKSEINRIFNRYFPQIKPIPIFFNDHKVKNYTNHKERLPFSFESLVVYKFECPSCQLAYIGSTKKLYIQGILNIKVTAAEPRDN